MNKRLKELRKHLGLTLNEFGSKLGVSASSISYIERDTRTLTESMIISICNVFNVNEDWLRNGTGEMFDITNDSLINLAKDYNLTETEIKLLTNYLCLDERKRKAIIEFMKNVF